MIKITWLFVRKLLPFIMLEKLKTFIVLQFLISSLSCNEVSARNDRKVFQCLNLTTMCNVNWVKCIFRMTSLLNYLDELESSVTTAKTQLSKDINNFFLGIVDSGFFIPNILKVWPHINNSDNQNITKLIITGINIHKWLVWICQQNRSHHFWCSFAGNFRSGFLGFTWFVEINDTNYCRLLLFERN